MTVQVNGDKMKEAHETFSANLANATGNATIADGTIHGFLRQKGRYATVDGPTRTTDSERQAC